jgi:hypothetical protein
MRNSGIFLGLSVLLLAFGCKKSPELATDFIPTFNGSVEANVSITNLILKSSFTGLNTANAEKFGFELSEKDATAPVVYSIIKPGSSEMVLHIDTALRESVNFKTRAWIVVGGKKFYSNYAYFTGLGFPAPELTSVSREYVIKGELFYITGKYFSNDYSNNKVVVKVDNVSANIVSATFNRIEVQMPELKTKGKVKISVNVLGKDAEGMLEIDNYWPEIYSVTPEAISPTDEISIKGKFRSSYKDVIYPVQNDFSTYKIVKYTDDEIIIRPGDYMNCDSTYCIYFSLINPYFHECFNSGYKVKHKGNWQGLNKAPFKLDADYRYYGLSCNGKGYVIEFNMLDKPTLFWKYDPQTDSWTKLPQFPGVYRIDPVFTECKGFIYCGLGFDFYSYKRSDFYKFDPTTNTWSPCAEFNFDYIDGASVFSRTIQDVIYVFSDREKQKAIYDPATNKWEISACNIPYSSSAKNMFVNKGNYYHQTDWQFYQYDPATNNFTLQYSTYDISYFASAFTAGDRIFMYGSCKIWEVDLINKRADLHNELSNYYSKDSFWSVKLFDINGESYFLTQPSIFSKFNMSK